MSNNISFVGRLGREPDLKNVGDFTVLEMAVANNTGFGDKQVTNWFKCTVWGKKANSLCQHLNKGSHVFITGELSLRKYTDKDGVEKMSPEVNVSNLDFCGDKQGGESTPASSAPSPAPTTAETEEDMPF